MKLMKKSKNIMIDSISDNGLFDISEIEYKGNFNINYNSKEELILLQEFFGVRRSKFDMKLLKSRPDLLNELKNYKYKK